MRIYDEMRIKEIKGDARSLSWSIDDQKAIASLWTSLAEMNGRFRMPWLRVTLTIRSSDEATEVMLVANLTNKRTHGLAGRTVSKDAVGMIVDRLNKAVGHDLETPCRPMAHLLANGGDTEVRQTVDLAMVVVTEHRCALVAEVDGLMSALRGP